MTRCTPLPSRIALACVLGASTLSGARANARDDDRFLMIDHSMRATAVTVLSIGPTSVRVTDEQGDPRDVALSDIVALAPGWWRPGTEGSELAWLSSSPDLRRQPAATTGMLLLTDGRRLVGRLAAEASDDKVLWDHGRLGRAVFPLDDVRRIQVLTLGDGARPAAPRAAGDRVVMTNGDVVTGFVDAVGNVVKVESEGKKVELSLRQVAAIELANPAKKSAGVRLWLADGSVTGAKGFGAPGAVGELRVEFDSPGAPEQVALSLADVVAVAPDAAQVRPLASLPIESQKGLGDRRYTAPAALRWRGQTLDGTWRESVSPGDPAPPLDAPDIELPGPMSVEWTLPPGTLRIAGWAEVPQESRMWAEFTLVMEGVGGLGGVASEGKVVALASESMSGTRPIVEFNLEIPRPAPERIRISIDPGARGPIQDRVVLRRTLLLVAPSAR